MGEAVTRLAVDRISSLPEAVIHDHIFSRISDKDVKVMSCLSKTWYLLSNSYPFLVFSKPKLEAQEDDAHDKYLNHINQTIHRFYDLNHKKDDHIIRKLSIPLNFRPSAAPPLDTWIKLVLQLGVEEFNLNINHNHTPTFYNLPICVFSHPNSIIKVANFSGCSLLHSFLSPLPNPNLILKKLSLWKVLMDDNVLSRIISSCPLIEDLSLHTCMGINHCLRISNLPKLKKLFIYNLEKEKNFTFEIDSLSLQSLKIIGRFKVRIIGCCPVLTDLGLWCVRELDLKDILSRFPMLRTLSLSRIDSLTNIKVSSDTLNKLMISYCGNLVRLNINNAPHLLSVSYVNFSAPRYLLADSSSVRWNVTFRYIFNRGLAGIHFMSLEDFLVNFSYFVSKVRNVDSLNLCFLNFPGNFSFEELKQRLVQPCVPNIDELKLFFSEVIRNDHLIVLDGVLWTCHPHTLSLKLDVNDNNYAVDSICKNIRDHRGGSCSCTLARRSWLHSLEDVIYMTKDGTESRLTMDGTSEPSSFYCRTKKRRGFEFPVSRSYRQIKFIFKW